MALAVIALTAGADQAVFTLGFLCPLTNPIGAWAGYLVSIGKLRHG